MKRKYRKCKLELWQPHPSIWTVTFLSIIMFNVSTIYAQDLTPSDFASSVPATEDTTRKLLGCNITDSGYGGPVIKFSRFNDNLAFMTGGRGSITIHNRYTIGGGGYGIANSIDIPGTGEDTVRLFKMGYGGVELGYIFLPGNKVNVGGSLLFAAGAAFWQNKPKNNGAKLFDDDFNIFPVLEPSLYIEVRLKQFMRLHTGISYRYVNNTHLDYISDENIRGFSCYVGLLFGQSK